ncbi:hypothetical protein B296_00036760 [Ensete ventricosum]|uniref:Uncharacterized protein n=1 Tax=Ensete ventricosum TaxID=4639 RepID=A0A426ZBE9_ENSVE|nr:hypothetical protein B296_00036760 [Ensete ventricosum]
MLPLRFPTVVSEPRQRGKRVVGHGQALCKGAIGCGQGLLQGWLAMARPPGGVAAMVWHLQGGGGLWPRPPIKGRPTAASPRS